MCIKSVMSSISSSVVPFSCLQSFSASWSFPMNQFFESEHQGTGASASASVFPMNIQCWFPLGWIGWISLLSKGLSGVFCNTTVQKHQLFGTQAFFMVQLSHPYMTTGKIIALSVRTCVSKVNNLRDDFKYIGGWGYIICKHTFYVRNLRSCRFWYPWGRGCPGSNPLLIPKDDCTADPWTTWELGCLPSKLPS